MKQSLQFRLSQHLALTPQLQQSIRLLQLSAAELNQEIDRALADNPLLERDDDPLATRLRIATDGSIVRTPQTGDAAPAESDELTPLGGNSESVEGESGASEDSLIDWGGRSSHAGTDQDDDNALHSWAASTPTLHEHLRAQLAVTKATPRDRALVQLLIEALDDDGYLTSPLEELLALCPVDAEVDPDDLRAALKLLQSFDPPGVGARSVAECLAIQLGNLCTQQAKSTPLAPALVLAKQIVSEHLPLLAARDYGKLRKLLGVDDNQLRAAQSIIRRLNPHPGVGFGTAGADYVVPDVFVRRHRGRWIAQLNADVMPRLRVNQSYADIVKRQHGDNDGKSVWAARLQEARWLIRNVQQRFETIQRVSQAIVERQHNFFTHGEVAMRPLVLHEIADTVGLHESTISRVTTHKYMATPFGVFELKYFFSSHVATETGGAASSTAIRALIKQLIGAEDSENPLTDSKIAELLGEQGIVVARRTVAKYREALKIAPVTMRKNL